MKKLHVAKELSLPLDAVTQTLAAIGRKGAGKTYLATMLAEQMLDAGAQVVAIDPVGNWWGLRVGADGKSAGKDIFIVGGDHGDVPLVPEAGARIARLIVEKGISAVLDVSGFRLGERKRFSADFGEELLHLKKSERSPVHLFIEEAQLLIPQRVGPEEARMVGAFEQLVRLGRNYGIGCTLVTQRPQSVNKEVLSQVECLCVLQVTGPHERKALEEWVQEVGADRKLVGELPGLARGEGYVWSPSWLRTYQRVRFAQKVTFDASATPEVGKAARAASLSAVDVEALKADLAEVVAKAQADDPKALRRRIAELEAESRKRPAAPPAPAKVQSDPKLAAQVRQLRKAVDVAMKFLVTINAEGFFKAGGETVDHAQVEKAIKAAVADVKKTIEVKIEARNHEIDRLRKESARVLASLKALASDDVAVAVSVTHNEPFTVAPRPPSAPPRFARVTGTDPDGTAEVGNSGLRRMLIALAQRPQGLTNRQLGVRAGISSRSGTFGTYLGRARSQGWISGRGHLQITEAGIAALGSYEPLPEGPELARYWLQQLGNSGAARMLRVILEAHPNPIDTATLGERAAISSRSGTFGTYLGRLRALELVEGRGELRASNELVEAR